MGRFVEGCDRDQPFLGPRVDDYVLKDNAAWIIDAFVGDLELASLSRMRH